MMSFLWRLAKDAPVMGNDREHYESRDEELDAARRQGYYKHAISYTTLRRFVISLFRPGFEEHLNTFVDLLIKVVNASRCPGKKVMNGEISGLDSIRMKSLWIPLLQDLLKNSETLKMSLTDPKWRRLYRIMLNNFLVRYEDRPWPDLPGSFGRSCVLCSCKTCIELNNFLVDPDKKICFITMDGPRLTHTSSQLRAADNDCTCWREVTGHHDVLAFKTNKAAERKWRRNGGREEDVLSYLKAFDQGKLYTVLGEREYLDLMNLRRFQASPDNEITPPVITTPLMPSRMPAAQAIDWAQMDADAAAAVNAEMKERADRKMRTLIDNRSSNLPSEDEENEPTNGPPLWIWSPANVRRNKNKVQVSTPVTRDQSAKEHYIPLPAGLRPIDFSLPVLNMSKCTPSQESSAPTPQFDNTPVEQQPEEKQHEQQQQQHIMAPENPDPAISSSPAPEASTSTDAADAAASSAPSPPPTIASGAPVEPPAKRARTSLPTLQNRKPLPTEPQPVSSGPSTSSVLSSSSATATPSAPAPQTPAPVEHSQPSEQKHTAPPTLPSSSASSSVPQLSAFRSSNTTTPLAVSPAAPPPPRARTQLPTMPLSFTRATPPERQGRRPLPTLSTRRAPAPSSAVPSLVSASSSSSSSSSSAEPNSSPSPSRPPRGGSGANNPSVAGTKRKRV